MEHGALMKYGMVIDKNLALEVYKRWILCMDADEVLSDN